jgi:Uri superfamily endonuclease
MPMAKSYFPCSYLLLVRFDKDVWVKVGALGEVFLPEGWYVYAGRAKRGIYQRIRRHLGREKKRFWHVDYLLEGGKVQGVAVFKGDVECKLVRTLCEIGVCSVFHPGLGSSDCRCRAHFLRAKEKLVFSWLNIGSFLKKEGLLVEEVIVCFSEKGSLKDSEIKVLASSGHCVSHNPESNC